MYVCAELVQLTVSQSDSELDVQRYGMDKNTLTVDPIMLEDEFLMRQCENLSQNCQSRFFENEAAQTAFLVFEFWGQFGFFENWWLISAIFIGFRAPLSDTFQ